MLRWEFKLSYPVWSLTTPPVTKIKFGAVSNESLIAPRISFKPSKGISQSLWPKGPALYWSGTSEGIEPSLLAWQQVSCLQSLFAP